MTAQLTDQIRTFLQERRVAILATLNQDGTIQQTVMWYLFENDIIVMNTIAGRIKERNIRRNPYVSVCFEEDSGYLSISGPVEFIDDPELGQRDIYRLAVRYHGEEQAQRQAANVFSKEPRVTMHLKCERILENLWEQKSRRETLTKTDEQD